MKPYNNNDKLKLQTNLSIIRKIAGWTASDLGELIGVTKQTINNLENNKTSMTKTQYIAIRAILDYEIHSNPENIALAQIVNILLDSEELSEEDNIKAEATKAYVYEAQAKGLNSVAISIGLSALATAFGVFGGTAVTKTMAPLWLEAISIAKKKI